MTAGGMPVWSLLKPLGLLALLVALGVAAVNHLAGPWSQRKLKELAVQVRTDLMSQVHPALALHLARGQAHRAHPRPRSQRRAARAAAARCARSQADRHLPRRARPDHQAGRAAYLRMDKGHVAAPPRERAGAADHRLRALPRRPEPARAARRPDAGAAPARALHAPSCCAPTRTIRIYKAEPGQLHLRVARAPVQPALCLRLRADRAGLHGPGPDHAHNRMQAVVTAFGVAVGCRILGIAAANVVVRAPLGGAVCSTSCRSPRRARPRCRSSGTSIRAAGHGLRVALARSLERIGRALASLVAARAALRRRASGDRELSALLGPRTLRRYVAKRFLLAILGAFTVCAVLIFMIDMIELLRLSRRATDLSIAVAAVDGLAAPAGLHGDPARVRGPGRQHRRAAQPQPQVGADRHARRRHVGVAVPAPGPDGGAGARRRSPSPLYNPLAAAARSEAERLVAEAFGKEASLLATLRRGLLAAPGRGRRPIGDERRAVADQGLSLTGVIVIQFDAKGQFVERIDADTATLGDGYWELQQALVSRPGREAERLRDLHGQHLPHPRARRRCPRVGDRGVRLAAARP